MKIWIQRGADDGEGGEAEGLHIDFTHFDDPTDRYLGYWNAFYDAITYHTFGFLWFNVCWYYVNWGEIVSGTETDV